MIRVPSQKIRPFRDAFRPAMAYYWAYGSNINMEQMMSRCPAAEPVSDLTVKNMGLLFRGCADVTGREGTAVPGALWRISRQCEATLDRFEGVGSRFYLKRYFTAITPDRERLDVLFYQMSAKRGIMPPDDRYLQVIADGYEDFGLDRSYLDAALQEAWGRKELTPQIIERYNRKGRLPLARRVPKPKRFVLTEDELIEAGARP